MGNFFSGIGKGFVEAWDDIMRFFQGIAKWFEDLWADFTWAYYVLRDIILIAGPFVGFLIYGLTARTDTEVDVEVVEPGASPRKKK